MELQNQIVDELNQCDITEQQQRLIGQMIYQICEDFELGLLNIFDDYEGLRIVLLDEMEQTGATIEEEELQYLNKDIEDARVFAKTFINELKIRFS